MGAAAADSAFALSELVKSLQADSLVEVLVRPPQPGQAVRGATYIVAALIRPAGDGLSLDVRAFNSASSQIVARASARALAAARIDTLNAVGRRVAQAIAAAAR